MGRKTNNRDREFSDNQKLKHENQRLKKEISRLRKLISRIEDFHEEAVETASEDEGVDPSLEADQLLSKWKCFNCSNGYLVLWLFDRIDGRFYKRKCNACKHSTRLKKYKPEVKGIKSEDLESLMRSSRS